jgi:hypothetical protein
MKNTDSQGLFSHMNKRNLTQAELDQMKRKKRKFNEASNTATKEEIIEIKNSGTKATDFKEPEKKAPVNIKECPFNPFGDDSCDMCGA